MSHDGSSCKSYIKHPTEKERLNHLAFTSFPEGYLPYASSSYQSGENAPPYLCWDEKRPRRSRKRRRRSCCNTAALVSAIALIVTAILAVVAISIYLGVVTNLFRSPVLSLSGKFRISNGDEFSEVLLNTTSYEFLVKAETYQAMVENVLLTSSLEPSFIAARIYAFRPGMQVFFRVYLDRRKLQLDDSSVIELVKDLVKSDSPAFGALSIDKSSVDVDENEEWLAMPGLDNRVAKVFSSTFRTTATTRSQSKVSTTPSTVATEKTEQTKKITPLLRRPTKPTTPRPPAILNTAPKNPVPVREVSRTGTGQVISIGPLTPEEDTLGFNYGQWKPVPIEDSVKPSFGDQRTPPGRGSVRHLDEASNPSRPKPSPRPPPSSSRPSSSSQSVGVGSVRVLEDAASHMDPIPVRNSRPLRPLIPESHQVGDVASSIMSSVSLVVKKPGNRTSTVPETGRLEMAKPLKVDSFNTSIEKEEPRLHRNDQASYRFLEDTPESVEEKKATTESSLSHSTIFEYNETTAFEEKDSTLNAQELKVLKNSDVDEKFGESFVEYIDEKDAFFPSSTAQEVTESEETEVETSEVVESGIDSIIGNNSNSSLSNSKNDVSFSNRSQEETEMPIYSAEEDGSKEHQISVTNLKSDDESKETNPYENTSDAHILHTLSKLENRSDQGLTSTTTLADELEGNSDSFPPTLSESTSSENSEIKIITSIPLKKKEINTLKNPIEVNGSTNIYVDKFEPFEAIMKLATTSSPFKIDKYNLKRKDNSTIEDHSKEGHGFHKLSFSSTTSNSFSSNLSEGTVIFDETTSEAIISSTVGDPIHETDGILSDNSNLTRNGDLPFSVLGNFNIEPDSFSNGSVNILSEATTTRSQTKNDEGLTEIINDKKLIEVINDESTKQSNETNFPSSTNVPELADIVESSYTISDFPLLNSSVIQGGVPKIVPQFQDLGFNPNEIDSKDEHVVSQDDFLENSKLDLSTSIYHDIVSEKDGEIIRHITTLPPTPFAVSLGKHPIFISNNCSEDEMQCASGECVDLDSRCNMRRDCRDNSDEKNCTCAEHLKVMGQSQKVCDGIPDCKDFSDESNCPWCGTNQIACPQTKFCINQSQICDGENDCPMGSDEKYCVKLAESSEEAQDIHYRSEGYLMVRKNGQWGKLCLDSLHDTDEIQEKIDDLGEAVCSALTYRSVSKSFKSRDPENGTGNYFVISSSTDKKSKETTAVFEPSVCKNKGVMKVHCNSLDCGHRPMGLSIRRRVVGGQSAGSGSWPWQVALYKEGDFQCGAVLVSDTWLISAGHCFFSTRSAYWTARLGLLRRGSELPSPSEQIRRIEQIIIHPDYVDKGFINDIALLRLDRPVQFSDYLRPLCLPLETEDAGLWHGKQCSVVGWGKLYEIGHTFPDSLQEVQLPVISTQECRKKIIFLSMYHITDNMFCAGYDRGGRDACLGDSGGPLMCQRDDGRWILLGVTSNGDGCGRPGRPGVYTKVTQYLSWISEMMESDYLKPDFNDTCEGVRCNLGRCIPPYKLCDSRWDCSEGSDEDNCLD